MKGSRDGTRKDQVSKSSSVSSLPLILDIEDFKGDFSFDALFGNLVNELLPSFQEEEADSSEGHGNIGMNDVLPNGNLRIPSDASKSAQGPLFPEVDALLSLFKDSCRELVDLQQQIDGRLYNLKKEVSIQDSKHRKTLAELEKGVDGLFDSFARLDSRISSVGQTAAKIGDHLQSADAQRETASQTIELIKYLMEFNSSPGDLMELSPLFSDDSRVAEAASIAQKLRSFAEEDIGRQGIAVPSVVENATASRGLEVAVANLQDYCNELENRLLSRFDAASQRRELSTMSECAKILSQVIYVNYLPLGWLFNLVGVIWVPPRSIEDMLVISFKGLGNSVRGKTLWQIACLTLIWMVWQERNNRIFEDKGRTEEMVWDLIRFYSSLWASCTEAFRGVPLSILQLNWIGFNRGTSAMQHYVATRPMFIDVEVMNADTRLVLGDQGSQISPSNVARGLSSLYKEITDTVRKEAATIMAVFPSPNDVMAILVQRVLEQRVTALLDKLLVKPSLVNLPPMEEGGLLLYLRMLAVAYEKTQELARDLRAVGCGDLDVEGLTESLFLAHKDEYPEHEQASLRQLYQAKMEEMRAESQQLSESSGTIGRSRGASVASSHQQISVTVVTEFVRWNEEAISRCTLFSSQEVVISGLLEILLHFFVPTTLATNVKAVFTCLLDQVSQYITEGLERARDSLNEAAVLRERFMLGTSVSRRVAAAAASAAEAAAAAGESSFRSFMVAVQRCASSVAIVQQYFANSISRLLLPVDGAHASSCEEMATAMSSAETAAYKGLQKCIETVMAEVERLLSAEQKATDYRLPDDGIAPDHRPTNACTRVVAYLSRVLEAAFTALEGLNKQAFLTELKFTFNPSGGLRLKRDITEYGEFVRSFNAPTVDEKFELLGIMANVFIVAPESLSSLFEGTPSIRKDAQRFIQLREDYKTAKLASRLSALWPPVKHAEISINLSHLFDHFYILP
ncbi:Exocyst complex component SEC10a [Vitis vinifera]|uniref:Exocyst complex component SEC10a n=1 Tax=Vitis vinifera TaxID=29760 RepID=A0A438EH53_VITVI|nr:Exocyst complex component SEC10a [Vitis vinifera]